ncbi:hypothetical protein HDU97_009982 [Phlyctochytrium planicorne]|nr:hypothetical protein HDU97_009982 [Phlyctochytrium planicorne]
MKFLILALLAFITFTLAAAQAAAKVDCAALVGRLQTAAEGSNLISESDFPFIPFLFQKNIPSSGFPTAPAFAKVAGITSPVKIETRVSAKTFIDTKWRPAPENKKLVDAFTDILRVGSGGIGSMQLYRIFSENARVEVFVVGKHITCGLLGVRSVSIET